VLFVAANAGRARVICVSQVGVFRRKVGAHRQRDGDSGNLAEPGTGPSMKDTGRLLILADVRNNRGVTEIPAEV